MISHFLYDDHTPLTITGCFFISSVSSVKINQNFKAVKLNFPSLGKWSNQSGVAKSCIDIIFTVFDNEIFQGFQDLINLFNFGVALLCIV